MLNWLTSASKKRIVRELRKILYDHPRYRADSNNVQVKFAFTERPQRGIIVDNASADRVRLSADNYISRLSSFCMLTYVGNCPGTSIEWVRENYPLLEEFSPRRDIFPSPPGVYKIKIKSVPDDGRNIPGQFTIDPLLTVINEPLITFQTSFPMTAQLSHDNIYPGSVRLYLDGKRPILDGVDFSVDPATGAVSFLKATPVGSKIYADYRYITPTQGPFPFNTESTDITSIPGVIIAFGDRVQECDEMAIVVTDDRTDVAEIYGGKYEVTFSLTVFSRDTEDREKLSDYVVIKVLEIQNALGYEGLELLDVSPGGEEEEVYNATIDDYYYESKVSLSMRVDWEIQKALPVVVWRVEQTSESVENQTGYLDGTVVTDLVKIGRQIELAGVPTVSDRKLTYERVR